MSNNYFLLKLLLLFQILNTVFGENFPEEGTTAEPIAILLPNKNPASITQINGFLPSLSKINSSEKVYADKQFNEKHVKTRVISHTDIDGLYNCTPDSVLSLLSLHSEFDNYFTCNQVLEIPHENKLNASLKRRSTKSGEMLTTPVNTFDSSVKLIFFKGNQMYYSTGRVEGGQCGGDILSILNVSLVKKGSCNLRSGVQLIVSDYALLNISGKCQSTCFGDVNVNISPGLRN